ncbi:MAG: hypothetical protein AB7N76_12020 [Planctomycetota bacterium]
MRECAAALNRRRAQTAAAWLQEGGGRGIGAQDPDLRVEVPGPPIASAAVARAELLESAAAELDPLELAPR